MSLFHVFPKASHSNSQAEVDADGDVEQQLYRDESRRVGNFEAVYDCCYD
jgi:hypothetical protein